MSAKLRSYAFRPRRFWVRRPAVSVVLITYNHSRYISEAISSVLDGLPEGAEILVVDDGSTDDTLEKASVFKHKAVRLLPKQNGGPSTALNHGIRNAAGKYIAIMSGDDVSLPGGIAERLDYLEKTGADIVSSVPIVIDDRGELSDDEVFAKIFIPPSEQDNLSMIRRLFFYGNFICAPSVMMRRSVFRKVGLHKDALFQLQDYELWLRSALAGFDIAISMKPFIKYRRHSNNLSCEANNHRSYWELGAILRRTLRYVDRSLINRLAPHLSKRDPDIIARGLLFLDHPHPLWRLASQEMLELAMLDNSLMRRLRDKRGLGPKELLERRARIQSEIKDWQLSSEQRGQRQ